MSAPTSGALNPNIFPEKYNGTADTYVHKIYPFENVTYLQMDMILVQELH